MLVVIGYVVVLLSVFGAYVGMGGHLSALYQPLELVLIGGAALGAYIAANSLKAIKLLLQDILQLMKKSKYDKALYLEILSCLFVLMRKSRSEGKNAIESHIEEPESSDIFTQYPLVLEDKIILNFICDYFRMIITSNMSSFELEQLMDEEIETCRSELNVPHKGLRAVGDGLPAFGIVAAVLGVVKALASIDQPPAILGDLISKAMVGTFLGILLAYGFVFPLADALESRKSESYKTLECIKVTLLAYMQGYLPPVALEFGRKVLLSTVRPSFAELEEQMQASKSIK